MFRTKLRTKCHYEDFFGGRGEGRGIERRLAQWAAIMNGKEWSLFSTYLPQTEIYNKQGQRTFDKTNCI